MKDMIIEGCNKVKKGRQGRNEGINRQIMGAGFKIYLMLLMIFSILDEEGVYLVWLSRVLRIE